MQVNMDILDTLSQTSKLNSTKKISSGAFKEVLDTVSLEKSNLKDNKKVEGNTKLEDSILVIKEEENITEESAQFLAIIEEALKLEGSLDKASKLSEIIEKFNQNRMVISLPENPIKVTPSIDLTLDEHSILEENTLQIDDEFINKGLDNDSLDESEISKFVGINSIISIKDLYITKPNDTVEDTMEISSLSLDSNLKIEDAVDNIENILESMTEDGTMSLKDSEKILKEMLSTLSETQNSEDVISKKEEIHDDSLNLNMNLNSLVVSEDTNKVFQKGSNTHPVAANILTNIQSQLSSANLNENTTKLRLKLFPSRLGSVSVLIENTKDGLSIKILSDNEDVRGLLSESIKNLQYELEKSTSNTVNVEVSNNQANDDKNQRENRSLNKITLVDSISESVLKLNSDSEILDKILDIRV